MEKENGFIRYLASKKTIDDQSLNREVWQVLSRSLPPSSAQQPLRILEVGAGIGTMLRRALEQDLFCYGHYTLVDSDPALVDFGAIEIQRWAGRNGYEVEYQGAVLSLNKPGKEVTASFLCSDALAFLRLVAGQECWDLVIAHAFLDLLDLNDAVPVLLSAGKNPGLFYFTLNFDGLTILEPVLDNGFDDMVMSLYHRTMDERTRDGYPSGDSRTGRHLFSLLKKYGGQILAAGASDWVVFAGPHGYLHDEAYFLRFIVETIEKALCCHPQLDPARFAAWIKERQAQIERGELVYIAHQIDFMGKLP